jgi:hypothetical protein
MPSATRSKSSVVRLRKRRAALLVPSAFNGFLASINVPGDHRAAANTRQRAVVNLLRKDFVVIEAFPSGSIPRYTALKGYADLDLMVALHYGLHIEHLKPAELLSLVQRSLSPHYKATTRTNGQAVTLHFTTWPKVDVVPVAQVVSRRGMVVEYCIPDANRNAWIYTKPKTHDRAMAHAASARGPEFKQAVKMLKEWNRQHSGLMQSFHLEMLAQRILSAGVLSAGFPWTFTIFFKEAAQLTRSPFWHRGRCVDEYLDAHKRAEVVKRLDSAHQTAQRAWYLTFGSNNHHKLAIEIWQQVFGSRFPSYGIR